MNKYQVILISYQNYDVAKTKTVTVGMLNCFKFHVQFIIGVGPKGDHGQTDKTYYFIIGIDNVYSFGNYSFHRFSFGRIYFKGKFRVRGFHLYVLSRLKGLTCHFI